MGGSTITIPVEKSEKHNRKSCTRFLFTFPGTYVLPVPGNRVVGYKRTIRRTASKILLGIINHAQLAIEYSSNNRFFSC